MLDLEEHFWELEEHACSSTLVRQRVSDALLTLLALFGQITDPAPLEPSSAPSTCSSKVVLDALSAS